MFFIPIPSGTPTAKRAIKIGLVLGALNQFCGVFSMINYANKIFEEAGSTLDPTAASVIVAIVQFSANFVSMIVVDRAGRKVLLTISTIGTSIGLFGMGFYDLFKDQFSEHRWIPIFLFSTIILMASIGILPLTFVILSEIIPKKVTMKYYLCFFFFNILENNIEILFCL